MIRPLVARPLSWIAPVALLLASFGRLVAEPSSLLVDAHRPTIDRARVVAAPPGNDLTRQFLPLHRWVARSIRRSGTVPEWDDRGFGGRPLVGNPQAGMFYPPVWLAWAISAPATLGWITLGHLVWAGFGMLRLTQTLRLSETSRMVAAGCFVLSPYVLAQAFEGHYPHVWAVAWYPWAFDSTIRLGRGRWRSGLGLSVSLAAVVLTGHPQEGYYLAIALGVWAGVDLVRMARTPGSGSRAAATVSAWAGVGLLTIGLLAVEIVPDAMTQTWGLRSGRMPLRLASRYHPSLINALQLANPFALGGPSDYFGPENYWETQVSIGLVPLILALIGATWTADRQRVRGWIILVVAATLFALGRKFGVFALMYETVPGMDRFRVPSRSLFLANLGAAVLVGFGAEALGHRRPDDFDRWVRLGKRWAWAAAVSVAAVGWGCWQTHRTDLDRTPWESSRPKSVPEIDRWALGLDQMSRQPTFWLATLGTSTILACGWLRPDRRGRLAIGLGVLGLVELAGSGYQVLITSPPDAFLKANEVERAVQAALPGRVDGPPQPIRIRADQAIVSDLMAVELGLQKTDISDTFQVQHAADLYQRLYDLSRPKPVDLSHPMDGPIAERTQRAQQAVFDRMGVALVFADRDSPRLGALFEANRWPVVATRPGEAGRADGWIVARNPSAMPRAYVVPRAEVVSTDDARLVDRFAEVDPRRAVLMTYDPLLGDSAREPREAFRAVEPSSSGPDRLTLRVTTRGPGLLVVADTWMPGWTARVDGSSTKVHRGNHAQRVIALPRAGRHEIVLSYEAPGIRVGLAISLASVGVWLLLRVVFDLARRPRPVII